jgi:pimeloyl-ACP methyl ester carboxylesterase
MRRLTLTLALLLASTCIAPVHAAVPARTARASAEFQIGMLRVERFGNARGTPLIFIPALFCGSWQWNGQIAMLSATHDIYAVTLPGFDGRARIAPTDLMNRVTADISTLIHERHIVRPIVVGHSLGGTIAVRFGERYPNDARGIITVEGGFPIAPTSAARSARVAKSVAPYINADPAALDRAIRNNLQYIITNKSDVDTFARLAKGDDANAIVDWQRAAELPDLTSDLHNLRADFTAIVPFDAYIDSYSAYPTLQAKRNAYVRWVAHASGTSSVVMIDRSRHFVMFDQPAAFDRALLTTVEGMER